MTVPGDTPMEGKHVAASKDVALTSDTISQYPVLSPDSSDSALTEIMDENMGSDGVQFFDLDRITLPAGGGIAWEVPTLDGADSLQSLEGIVVAWRAPRAYWAEALEESGGGQPPDCSSQDGVIGVGAYGVDSETNPEGRCDKCPMNEWGSGRDGRGKGCGESRQLFMLLPGRNLPVTVSLPVTSIAPFRKYMLRLAGEGIPYYGVITKLGLKKTETSGGIKYSVVEPKKGETLDAAGRAAAKSYGDTLKKSFQVG